MAKKKGRTFGDAKVTQQPVYIAWFDELKQVQVTKAIPQYRTAKFVRFEGRMEMFGYNMTVKVQPRIAASELEAMVALRAEHVNKAQIARENMLEEMQAIELVERAMVDKFGLPMKREEPGDGGTP